MTGKEIVLKAMKFERTPRLPVAVLDGYVWTLRHNGLSFQDLVNMEDGGAALMAKTYEDLGSDIVSPNTHVLGCHFEVMGGSVSCDKVGEAFEVTRPPLEEISDIEKFDVDEVFAQLTQKKAFQSCMGMIRRLKEHFGDEKLIVGGVAAPLTAAGMMLGVQNFMLQLYDDEEGTAKLLDFAADLMIKEAEYQVAQGVDALIIADPVSSGDLISPAMFEEFAMPYLKKMMEALKKYNLPIIMHICGHTQARLESLKQLGISGFSLAAVDLKTALDTVKGDYAIFGNMDPYEVIQSMTPEQVYETCSALADIAGLDGGYVMMPGCDLPPASPLENIQAMVRAAHDKTAD